VGERAATSLPKQFLTIGGRPLLAWAFDILHEGGCDPIVVVVAEEHMDRARDLLSLWGDDVVFTAGGRTRQDSVRAGLAEVRAETVVVHDAARPFASPDSVRAVCAALAGADGAVVAVPLEDTIKEVDGQRVTATVDRSKLWRSQTPQAFRTALLREAHQRAHEEGFVATDDAELVERAGGTVAVVPGSPRNIKITRPSDLELAELLAARGER
jgi:2-C-methyl-D-erythritol 4-phosphate cytidylyltransferase